MLLKKILYGLLDIIFPVYCAGKCGKEKTHCCKTCFSKIQILEKPLIETFPDSKFAFEAVYAAGIHDEKSTLGRLIHRFKYDSSIEIGKMLASLFPKSWKEHLGITENSVLVPVPLNRRRFNSRGFNQSEILAYEIGKTWGVKMKNLIKRHRYTQPQVELNRENRLKNLRGAFSIKDPAQKLKQEISYFIVDDVATTGTTLNECAKILRAHGAQKIFGLVAARPA